MSEPTPIEISVAELAARRSEPGLLLLDVREQGEYDLVHIAGAELIPLAQIPMHLETLMAEPEREVICYCHSGRRSLTAADWLRRAGCSRARSLAGGIDAWAREIDPSLPRY